MRPNIPKETRAWLKRGAPMTPEEEWLSRTDPLALHCKRLDEAFLLTKTRIFDARKISGMWRAPMKYLLPFRERLRIKRRLLARRRWERQKEYRRWLATSTPIKYRYPPEVLARIKFE